MLSISLTPDGITIADDGGQWGFDCMGGTDPSHYNTSNDERCKCNNLCVFFRGLKSRGCTDLKYLAARFASFDNVWWSMANEWSDCACKSLGSKRPPILRIRARAFCVSRKRLLPVSGERRKDLARQRLRPDVG